MISRMNIPAFESPRLQLRALQAAYEDFGWKTAVSVIAVDNAASHAVALRLGAKVESRIAFRGGQADVYRHLWLDALKQKNKAI
jgi:RimJ/RimL family protein N-acetyltransferase